MMLKGIPDEITRLLEHERSSFSCIMRISKTVKLGHHKCNQKKEKKKSIQKKEGEKDEKIKNQQKKFQDFSKEKRKVYPQVPS